MNPEEDTTLKAEYSEAIEYLYGLQSFGARLGLGNIQTLCSGFKHPEKDLRFIHVAGSNGKGSVCAMLESIYRHAGYRTGLFTSPHLISFGERIQVNRSLLSKGEVVRLTQQIRPALDSFSVANHPTFFEVITLMALLHFHEEKCDIVLWETGLGGRLDSTNIVTPLASLITNISLEHQQYLGSTLPEIAREKAGIIKRSVPVITAEANAELLQIIKEEALKKESPFFFATLDSLPSLPPQFPEYQKSNISLVLKTIQTLQSQLPVFESSLYEGLKATEWPGRFHIIQRNNQKIVLDGAHNVAGFTALIESFKKRFNQKPHIVIGVLADKDWNNICQLLAPHGASFSCVPVPNPRSLAPAILADKLRKHTSPQISVTTQKDTRNALNALKEASLVLVCGSLYLISEALSILSQETSPHPLERELNNWSNTSLLNP